MVKISITIPALHPSIIGAILENGAAPERVLVKVNEEIELAQGGSKVEHSGKVTSKESAKTVTIQADGKLKGMSFSKDSAAGLVARINWYLDGSRELYTRIGSIQLPNSVITWLKSKELQMTTEELTEFNAKLAALREETAKAKAKA